MKPDSPLAKYRPQGDQPDDLILPDAISDSYTPSRMASRSRRLVLYCSDGDIHAQLYSNLLDVIWNAQGDRIALQFLHCTAEVKGRNLQGIAAQIAGEKAAFLLPFDVKRWPAPSEGEPCIDRIAIAEVETDEASA